MRKYMVYFNRSGNIDFFKADSLKALEVYLGRCKGLSPTSDGRVFLFEKGNARVFSKKRDKAFLYLNS